MAKMMTRTLQLFSLQNDCLMKIFMFLEFEEIVRIDTSLFYLTQFILTTTFIYHRGLLLKCRHTDSSGSSNTTGLHLYIHHVGVKVRVGSVVTGLGWVKFGGLICLTPVRPRASTLLFIVAVIATNTFSTLLPVSALVSMNCTPKEAANSSPSPAK